MRTLMRAGAEVRIWSGRSDAVRTETIEWLNRYFSCGFDAASVELKMRRDGDFTPDEKLKESWLDELSPDDAGRLVAVFDDRDKVVRMWREAGVSCFQVAPGEF